MRVILLSVLAIGLLGLSACGDEDGSAFPEAGTYVRYDRSGKPNGQYVFGSDGSLVIMQPGLGGSFVNFLRDPSPGFADNILSVTYQEVWNVSSWTVAAISQNDLYYPAFLADGIYAPSAYMRQYGSPASGKFTRWNCIVTNGVFYMEQSQTLTFLSPTNAKEVTLSTVNLPSTNRFKVLSLAGGSYRLEGQGTAAALTNEYRLRGNILYSTWEAAYRQ